MFFSGLASENFYERSKKSFPARFFCKRGYTLRKVLTVIICGRATILKVLSLAHLLQKQDPVN